MSMMGNDLVFRPGQGGGALTQLPYATGQQPQVQQLPYATGGAEGNPYASDPYAMALARLHSGGMTGPNPDQAAQLRQAIAGVGGATGQPQGNPAAVQQRVVSQFIPRIV